VREKKEFVPMEVLEFLRKQAAKGGKKAASKMTPEQRKERARKAAAASAKVRSKKARAKKAEAKAQAAKGKPKE
jgi:hypothetical protein